MDVPDKFQLAEGYAIYRPVGETPLEKAAAGVTQVIEYCYQNKIKRLLIDATGLTRLRTPSLAERYEFAKEWATASGGAVKFVVVVAPELIDSEKFGVTVAKNRGAIANVFASEPDAVAWLLDTRTD